MPRSRRSFLATLASAGAASLLAQAPTSLPHGVIEVVLLGTGGPELSPEGRQGAATLVLVNGLTLLFDAGRGVLQRLYQSGSDLNSVDTLFLTHLHSDHIVGLPELWITPWFMSRRRGPTHVLGPVGTKSMLQGISLFLASDIRQRAGDFNRAEDLGWDATEFSGSGIVFTKSGVTISTVPVDHKEGNPAFGFVLQAGGRKLVLSGDCTLSEALIAAGQNADLVIHNVYAPSPALLARDPNKRIVAQKLASPEQAAEVFRRTATRAAVYSHIILLDSTKEQVIARTRAAGYTGQLTLGEDLMRLHIGETVDVVNG